MDSIAALERVVVRCRRCPRLVRWREEVAARPPRRYRGERYWARPLPGFGDPRARLLVVGLAPAAHGGNRTGRIFTGDRSGDWLYETLYAFGFSDRPRSLHRDDGLRLRDCYVTAAVRCAPPANKPTREEFENCRPYLLREWQLLARVRVVIALGKLAFDSFLSVYASAGGRLPRPRPRFAHGASFPLSERVTLLGCYHPSQQNTFTGKLTRPMFHSVFAAATRLLESRAAPVAAAESER
jgi:uracil-DNA glycosylase family 4